MAWAALPLPVARTAGRREMGAGQLPTYLLPIPALRLGHWKEKWMQEQAVVHATELKILCTRQYGILESIYFCYSSHKRFLKRNHENVF